MTVRFGVTSFVAIAILAFVAGCGGDDGPTDPGNGDPSHLVPASWGGIWDLEIAGTVCGEDVVSYDWQATDTLCVGEPLVLSFEVFGFPIGLECGGTIDDVTFDFVCIQEKTVPVECDVSLRAELTGVRDGNAFTATGPLTWTAVDECFPPGCFGVEITGTRTSTAQPGCSGTP